VGYIDSYAVLVDTNGASFGESPGAEVPRPVVEIRSELPMELRWNAVSGCVYRVEFADSLDGSFTNCPGSDWMMTNRFEIPSVPGRRQGFWRVRAKGGGALPIDD